MLKKRKIKKSNGRGRLLIFVSVFFIIVSCVLLGIWYFQREVPAQEEEFIAKDIDLELVKSEYHDFVRANDGIHLYLKNENEYVVDSTLYGGIELQLDPSYEVVDEYFKVLNGEYYILYSDVTKIDFLSSLVGEYKYYKNYIPYNENVVLKSGAKLYVNDSSYYEVTGGSYPIIIKDGERYGIEYHDRLVYVGTGDVESVLESSNTTLGHTDGISVLNYHFVVSATNENNELKECKQSICITDEMFDSHIKYLKDNGYYGVSMRDLELFIDGKIQLPEKSVSITIDDGWYVGRSIMVLERYQILGTLFLIGSLASPQDYAANYLEVHSHTWDMHSGNDCPGTSWRGGLHCFSEQKVLEDLRKSRESLNNTTYFCYPFYEVTTRAINLLKEAGFTMAFAGMGSNNKVRVGQDKFRIPRYVIANYTTMNDFIRYVS